MNPLTVPARPARRSRAAVDPAEPFGRSRRSRRLSRTTGMAAAALATIVTACGADAPTATDATVITVASDPSAPVTTAPETTDGGTTTGTTTGTTVPVADDSTATADPADPVDAGGAAIADLTDVEVAGLLWMREEEQLAHDVYRVLGEEWGVRVFENITRSEQTHIDAAIDLLVDHGLGDPAAGNPEGTFTDPAIQELYDRLVADGGESLVAALQVGALIEELDIADLRERAALTDDPAIDDLYARLELGSRNHLRAFTSQLEARGVTYEPTVLDVASYEAIVTSAMERGH